MKKIPKTVPFFENSSDNVHCLQACIKSILSFYFPERNFLDAQIDKETMQLGGWSWFPPAVIWLHSLGLDVKLYSEFNYKEFGDRGYLFLKDTWGEERYNKEYSNGALKNIEQIQKASKEMEDSKLWIDRNISTEDLIEELEKKNSLAIGKTIYEWLSGNYLDGISHYVLIIREDSGNSWKIHDPGLPGEKYRKILKNINNHSILGDVLLIRGLL